MPAWLEADANLYAIDATRVRLLLLNPTLAPRAGSLSQGGWGCARPETPGFVVAVVQ